jgi:hypothetical protein
MKPVVRRALQCGVVILFGGIPLFAQTAGPAQTTPGAAASPRVWNIPLSPCGGATGRNKAMCGSYEVFENRAAHSGRRIKLNLMVLPAMADKPEPDPVFLIDGGPGGSAVQEFAGFGQLESSRCTSARVFAGITPKGRPFIMCQVLAGTFPIFRLTET